MSNIVPLKKLNNRHLSMIEALILHGKKQREVCKQFGITETRLSLLRKTSLFQEEEKALRERIRDENITKLNALVPVAIETLEETVGVSFEREDGTIVENDQKVRVKAAKEILNRAGYKSQEKSQGQSITISMFNPPWNRKPGEEDNNTITVTTAPEKYEEE